MSKREQAVIKTGNQYFDFFTSAEDEVFVDCGAYNGDCIEPFLKWCNGSYRAYYAFEPMEDNYQLLERKVCKSGMKNTYLCKGAVWNKNEDILLSGTGSSATCKAFTGNFIKGVTLDSVIKEKATFIKMDIEGSEYEALCGMKNILVNDKPKLAICIYHRLGDFIKLASYIKTIVPEYKFGIRNYRFPWSIETVLYGEVQ